MFPYPEGFSIIGETTVFDMLKGSSIKEYNDFEIVQFTGLLDKNGKEIYEGDIVENKYGISRVIEFDSIAYGCQPFIEIAGAGWQGADGSDCKIIGNIYEKENL